MPKNKHEYETRVVLASANPADNRVVQYKDITSYLYELDENGRLKKDEDGKLIKTGNHLVVSEQPLDIGNGNIIAVYRFSLVDKEGSILKDTDGKLLIFDSELKNKDSVRVLHTIPLVDGKVDEKYVVNLIKENIKNFHSDHFELPLGRIAEKIEEAKTSPDTPASQHMAMVGFQESLSDAGNYRVKEGLKNTGAIISLSAGVVVPGQILMDEDHKPNLLLGAGMVVTGLSMLGLGSLIKPSQLGKTTGLGYEVTVPFVNSEGANALKKFTNNDFFSDTVHGADLVELLKKAAKEGTLDEALQQGSELSKQLNTAAKRDGYSFSKEEAELLIEAAKKFGEPLSKEDDFKELKRLKNIGEKLGISGSGSVIAGNDGITKRNTGWMKD
jgi:hypothetical protein